MTNTTEYSIIDLSNEREENNMRKLVYLVGGLETTSYAKARELQPTGKLKTRLDEIREKVKVSPETLAKRQAYFARRRAKKAVASN